MSTQHPFEEELQNFALGHVANELISEHISVCAQCKKLVMDYQLLHSLIKEQEKVVFDFDVSSLVLGQIKSPEHKYSKDNYVFYGVALMTTMVVIMGYWFRELFGVIGDLGGLLLPLLVTTGLFVLVFQVIDVYQRYKNKLSSLNQY